MMDKTAHYQGDKICVNVLVRGEKKDDVPNEYHVLNQGRFFIQDPFNEGASKRCNVAPCSPITTSGESNNFYSPSGDGILYDLRIAQDCEIPPGEYNIRFEYKKGKTEKISIEIY